MKALYDLALHYSCDKLHSHSYIPIYEQLFAGMQAHKTVKKVLEIGIGYEDLMKDFVPRYVHGASLKMWEAYFPQAQIFACDVRLDTLFHDGRVPFLLLRSVKSAVAARGGCRYGRELRCDYR